jgi:hypothetical protein
MHAIEKLQLKQALTHELIKSAAMKRPMSKAQKGALLGSALAGPLGGAVGAGIGAKHGRSKGETYKGSPVLRAFGAGTLGMIPGHLLTRAALKRGNLGAAGLASLLSLVGGTVGAGLGARSAYTGKKN